MTRRCLLLSVALLLALFAFTSPSTAQTRDKTPAKATAAKAAVLDDLRQDQGPDHREAGEQVASL